MEKVWIAAYLHKISGHWYQGRGVIRSNSQTLNLEVNQEMTKMIVEGKLSCPWLIWMDRLAFKIEVRKQCQKTIVNAQIYSIQNVKKNCLWRNWSWCELEKWKNFVERRIRVFVSWIISPLLILKTPNLLVWSAKFCCQVDQLPKVFQLHSYTSYFFLSHKA